MQSLWIDMFNSVSNSSAEGVLSLSAAMAPTMDAVFLVIYLIAGIFLIALLYKLYKMYRETESLDILLFFLGLLLLMISNIIFIFRRMAYASGGASMGDFLTILLQFPSELGVLFISLFAIRATFPKRSKVIFSSVFVVVVIKWIVETWVILQGPPLYNVINLDIVYSLEYALIRLGLLLPLYAIPPAVFFYYAKVIRQETKPKSTRAFWLGFAMLCFAIPFLIVPIAVVTVGNVMRLLEILVLPAPIIFYICFTMPEWFKRRIGWSD
jgi:hypothetical protein